MENNNENILTESYTVSIVDYENYENWLEEKEADGWNLKSVEFKNSSINSENSYKVTNIFEKGEKRKIRYCLDFKYPVENDYKQFFKDFGWTLVSHEYKCLLWAMKYTDERPEAFNNIEVIEEQGKRYIKNLIGYGSMYLAFFIFTIILTINGSITPVMAIVEILFFATLGVIYKRGDIKAFKAYQKNKKLLVKNKIS